MTAINWQAWDAAARALSFDQQKLMMVYCHSALDHWGQHWLREIEAHDDLSESINAVTVPIKILVDEEPELATRVQEVLAVTSASQGWPAIAWFTPNGNPLGATPYRPVFDGELMRGFAPMLIEIIEAWHGNRASLEADVEDMRSAWRFYQQIIAEHGEKPVKTDVLVNMLEAHIMDKADGLEGGFGEAPRELPISWLQFLLERMAKGVAAPSVHKHVELSLNALLAGGIHDHLQGGFFRASTDDAWAIPFFEKRCSDQARLIPLLLQATAVTGKAVYAECAERCFDYIQNYLRLDNGTCVYGFEAESLGAGKQLINGAAYTWSLSGVADIIGDEAAQLIAKRFLSDERIFVDDEFACLAVRGALSEAEREQLPSLCHRLLAARLERPQPTRDERVTILNQALVLIALTAALRYQENHEFINWANQLEDFLINAEIESCADMAWAGWALVDYAALQQRDDLSERVLALATGLKEARLENGLLPVTTQAVFADAAIVSSDGPDVDSALSACLRLWRQLRWDEEADGLLAAYGPLLKAAPMAHASVITAI